MSFYRLTALAEVFGRPVRLRSSALALLCTPFLLTACPIDDRSLFTGSGGSADGGAGHATGGGGTTSGGNPPTIGGSNDGGQAGEADDGPPLFVDGCTDLDSDGVSDCTETLVENSAFKMDVAHWTAEPGVTIDWDAQDLLGAVDSGSAFVTSSGALDAPGDGIAAAAQCVPVSAGQVIDIAANALIDAGPVQGRTVLILWFFPTDTCGNAPVDVYKTSEEFATGKRITLRGTKAVDRTGSMLVRLGVVKPFKADSFSVRFDNVLIGAE